MDQNQLTYNPSEDLKEFHFLDTTATQKIFALKKRIRAVAGGTSASKTISILIWLIDYCQALNPDRTPKNLNKLCTVTSESYPHLLKGAILDFQNIMKDRGYWKDELWHDTHHVYTFETGNKLEFATFDTYSKAHGSRRDVLFVNEGNNMPYNIVDQLMVRTREVVWLDWNPTTEFWFYTEILGRRDDVDFITLTYKDNEALDENTIREIESHKYNRGWWQVYGLGELGDLEGKIYTGWQIIDEVPEEARLEKYGLDFGYSIDPTAIPAVYKWNDSIILDEIIYQKGLSNRQISEVCLNIERASVIADSAEPKSIDEIASYGVPIFPSTKGPDSVRQGIQVVQDKKIFVTKRSVNILKEYRNYLWKVDKNGDTTKEPSDIWNHMMDAIRYALSSGKGTVNWEYSDPGGVSPYIEGIG